MTGFNMVTAGTGLPAPTPTRRPIRRAAVAGATGGIGRQLVASLLARPDVERVFALRRPGAETAAREADGGVDALAQWSGDPRLVWCEADLENEASLARAAGEIATGGAALDLAIIATGLLHAAGIHPERRIEDVEARVLARLLAVNAIGPLLLARQLLPRMRAGADAHPVLLALSARVGSLTDNRLGGWYAYRMGKAALNQGFRTLAVETRRRWPRLTVALYHPGTVATRLSAPFAGGGQGPAHARFTPLEAARHCLALVDRLGPADHGGFFAWDGSAIPW